MVKTTRSFAHSISWNLAGAGIPLAFAFSAVPTLLAGYGNERFGLLTIIWALIGYFSIFDFGLGRALTKLVSERLGSGGSADIPDIAQTALFTMFLLGFVACLLLTILAPAFAHLLKLPPGLYGESVLSLRILALGIPFVIASAGLIGLLEARAQFHSINQIRLMMGLLNFAAPLLMLTWSPSLVPATAALAICRVITTCLYFVVATRIGVLKASTGQFRKIYLKELLGYGSWITLSNLISPFMAQLDKIVIGGVLALHLLPLYAVPGDLINRFSFIPVAVIGVFFPAFAARWATGNRNDIVSLYGDAGSAMFAVVFPIALALYALAPEALALWISQEFSQQAAPLMRWLCVGLLANASARIPHALLQAIGRPDITAKLHLLELPLYAIALPALLERFGILGAAIAWTGRMILDLALLTLCTCVTVPEIRSRATVMLTAVAGGTAILFASPMIPSFWARSTLCIPVILVGMAHVLPILIRTRHDD